jgi:hypothetical protein
MEPAMLRTGWKCRILAPAVAALALAAVIGGASTAPARAQENEWSRGHDSQRGHDERHHYRRSDRDSHYYYSRPSYVYAPPPVYYAPPPGPPVIDFVFPLRFR